MGVRICRFNLLSVPFRHSTLRWFACCCAIGFAAPICHVRGADAPVSFYHDVQPILSRSCTGCHRPAKKKGKLDVTTYAALKTGGKKGQTFVAGKPEKSLLIDQVTGDEPAMPQKGQKLTAAEVGVLSRWIAQGARDDSPAIVASSAPDRPAYPATYAMAPVITAIACSPDGTMLAVGGSREVLLQHADGSGVIARLPSASERITSLQFTKDGARLIASGGSAGEAGRIECWNVSDRKLLHACAVSQDTVFGLSLDPAAGRAAVGCADRTVRVISLADGKELARFDQSTDWALCTAFNRDGTKLLAGGRDKMLRLFDLPSRRQIDEINEPVESIACLAERPASERSGSRDEVAAGEGSGVVRIFDISTLKKRTEDKRDPNRIRELERLNGTVNALAYSADGKWLAAAATGEARVFSADDGHRVCICGGNVGPVYTLCFSPDAKRLYTAGFDGQLRVFEPEHGKMISSFVPVPIGPNLRTD